MSESLRALLAGLIDYAGLFPPAKLPLPEALANYVRYRASPDVWMLGRFICPAARLAELTPLKDLFQNGEPLTISALGRGGATASEFLTGLRADLADITACRQEHSGRVVIDVMELRLPTEKKAARDSYDRACKLTRSAGLTMFVECGSPLMESLSQVLAMVFVDHRVGQSVGFKLRTGGLEPAAFPSSEQIRFVLAIGVGEGVPFKATAGLHHPFPRFDPTVQARMYGFINLFTAGVLIRAGCKISAEQLRAILDDDDPAHFRFTDAGLEWQGLSASTVDIVRARQTVLSFGSCSFDEPRDDLRALGWL
jgi:hypothetical protein